MHSEEKTSTVLVLSEEDTKELLDAMHNAANALAGKEHAVSALGALNADEFSALCGLVGYASAIENEMGF